MVPSVRSLAGWHNRHRGATLRSRGTRIQSHDDGQAPVLLHVPSWYYVYHGRKGSNPPPSRPAGGGSESSDRPIPNARCTRHVSRISSGKYVSLRSVGGGQAALDAPIAALINKWGFDLARVSDN